MAAKRSTIWEYFTAGPVDLKAKCNTCDALISRGGNTPAKFTTTNMANHLKHHPAVCVDFEKSKRAKVTEAQHATTSGASSATRAPGQQTLGQSYANAKMWDIDSPKAQEIHLKIAEMIDILIFFHTFPSFFAT